MSTKAETLVNIGSVVVEIFGEISHFLPYCLKSYSKCSFGVLSVLINHYTLYLLFVLCSVFKQNTR